ncbi:hypothetical protein BH11PLA2_BH11PLA2_08110 [soil metagenome]
MNSAPTIIDDLLARFTPALLDHATGAGVTVAVLDTGMSAEELCKRHATVSIADTVAVQGSQVTPIPAEQSPSSFHGTTVADIILRIAPQVTLYSADVFGSDGACEVETIIAAIRHALDVWNVKVINLSLGVAESRLQQANKRQQLQRIIEEAYFRDCIVVAAAHNDHPITRSFPAIFAPPLFSVDKALFDENELRIGYRLHDNIEFEAHSRGHYGPFSREPATSWATPHVTGIAARLLSLKPTLKPFELKAILYWLSRFAR